MSKHVLLWNCGEHNRCRLHCNTIRLLATGSKHGKTRLASNLCTHCSTASSAMEVNTVFALAFFGSNIVCSMSPVDTNLVFGAKHLRNVLHALYALSTEFPPRH